MTTLDAIPTTNVDPLAMDEDAPVKGVNVGYLAFWVVASGALEAIARTSPSASEVESIEGQG